MRLTEVKDPDQPLWRTITKKGGQSGDVMVVPSRSITTLRGCPQLVDGTFDIEDNYVGSLVGGPRYVGIDYIAKNCNLTNLDGIAETVGGGVYVAMNKITNLHNIHKQLKNMGHKGQLAVFSIWENPLESHILGLCLIDGIIRVALPERLQKATEIINNIFTKTQDKSERLLLVQDELIEAGFDELAQL